MDDKHFKNETDYEDLHKELLSIDEQIIQQQLLNQLQDIQTEIVDTQDNYVSLPEFIKQAWPYGFISFGGPMAHIGLFERKFVHELKWINHDKFIELFAICQSIPGPTSVKLFVAIGCIKTNSIIGGIIAIFLLCVPAGFVLLLIALKQKSMRDDKIELPIYISQALKGFQCAAVSLVAQAAYNLSKPQFNNILKISIIFGTSLIFFIFQNTFCLIILLIIGGSLTLYYIPVPSELQNIQNQREFQEIKQNIDNCSESSEEEHVEQLITYTQKYMLLKKIKTEKKRLSQIINQNKERRSSLMRISLQSAKKNEWPLPYGQFSLYSFIIIFVLLIGLRASMENETIDYMSSFYYIGSIIFGGGMHLKQLINLIQGHAILPIMAEEFQQYITKDEFWSAFSLISAFPGPMFNLPIYIGVFIDGTIGAVLGWICLMLPSLFMIWGALPYWDKLRENVKIQIFLQGLGCASIGFIYTATFILLGVITKEHAQTSLLLSIISFILLQVYHLKSPYVILFGGFYFNFMYLYAQKY